MKPVFKTTWEIGTAWKLRTATSVPRPIQYIEMDLRNKTTPEFRTPFDSPLGVPNSQVPLYRQLQWTMFMVYMDYVYSGNMHLSCTYSYMYMVHVKWHTQNMLSGTWRNTYTVRKLCLLKERVAWEPVAPLGIRSCRTFCSDLAW